MLREIRPTLSLILLATLVLGLIVPGVMTGIAQVAFPFQANGSLVQLNGVPVGSALIGQNFIGPAYFHSRPSALSGVDAKGVSIATPDDASESGGSNLAPTSRALIANVTARVAAYRKAFGPGTVPADAVESSASGLDPDISRLNAMRQAPAVARARHIPRAMAEVLVEHLATGRFLGFIGTDHVNVLRLNLALDRAADHPGLASAR